MPDAILITLPSEPIASVASTTGRNAIRVREGRYRRSPELHQHLSEVLALEQFEKGCGRVLDAVVYGFPPCDLAFLYPGGHLSLELGHEIQIGRDVVSLHPKALSHDEHDGPWSRAELGAVVLRDHSADRQ